MTTTATTTIDSNSNTAETQPVGTQEALMPQLMPNDTSTVAISNKRKKKKKKKKTTNGTTATIVASPPVSAQEAFLPQETTNDDSTMTIGSKRKRKKKRKKKNSTTVVVVVTNETLGRQEALPPQLTMTDDSTMATGNKHKKKRKKKNNGTTTVTMATSETVGGQEALSLQLATTNGSTVTTSSEGKKKKTTTNDTTVTVVMNEMVAGQGPLSSQLTMTNDSTATATGQKPKKKKKKKKITMTTTNVTIMTGRQTRLITVKLHDAIVNSKPDDPPTAGRLSEAVVHQYFVEQLGPSNVKWVNQDREFGLPYDIVITRDGVTEYVKVKEAMDPNKNWFHTIQAREWQFMSEKRDCSSIAHVLFFPGRLDEATIVMLRNPHRLCEKRRDLALALVMPKEFEEHFTENMNQNSWVELKPDNEMTGRLGEAAVHQYLVEQMGPDNVKWVNQHHESWLPYDIVVTKGGAREYVEVKATVCPNKNWFEISAKEWKFIVEKGEELSIARVLLSGENMVSITMLKDPLRLYEQHDLNLTLLLRGKLRAHIRRIIMNKLN